MAKQNIIKKACVLVCVFGCLNINTNAQKLLTVDAVHEKSRISEFGMVPYKSGWTYVSSRPVGSIIKYVDEKSETPLYNVVQTDSTFSKEKRFHKPFNANCNNGPVTFSNDFSSAVITRNLPINKKFRNTKQKLGLFFMKEKNGEWKDSAVFPYNSVSYSCAQATLNKAGDQLVFMSDMPGGYGGTDLYYSYLTPDGWAKPENLGPKMNSEKNEMFPFLHPDGKFYFSSDRPGGKGGLDIYFTRDLYFTNSNVVPMDSLINGPGDDFSFWSNVDNDEGYFSSDRNGIDQLFSFKLKYPEFVDCKEFEEIELCYEFSEEATIDVKNLPLVYEWDFGDGHKIKKLSAEHCFEKPGTYTIQLNVFDTTINKLYMNEARYELVIKDIKQPLVVFPDSIYVNDTLFFSAGKGTWEDFTVENYFWKLNNEVVESSAGSFKFPKAGAYDLVLGLTSSTDKDGIYIKTCFQKRFVVTNEPFSYQAMDVSRFISNPDTSHNTNDTPIDYQLILNESASRKKIDEVNFSYFHERVKEYYFTDDSLYKYTIGSVDHPIKLKALFDSVHNAGFVNAHVTLIDSDIEVTSQYEVSQEKLNALSGLGLDTLTGKTFELAAINFDYNQSGFRPEGLPSLDTIVTYMKKHPAITLEISAHTDNIGTDQYNKDLSQQRATSVYAYIQSKGIDPNRMIRIGYGELHPKYSNTTQDNMNKNRRVEFRLLK